MRVLKLLSELPCLDTLVSVEGDLLDLDAIVLINVYQEANGVPELLFLELSDGYLRIQISFCLVEFLDGIDGILFDVICDDTAFDQKVSPVSAFP